MTRRYRSGSVYWRADRDRWVGLYEVHDGSARRKRQSVSAKTRADCERKLREAIRVSAILPAYDPRRRLDAFLRAWLDEHVAGTVRPRTADFYRSVVEHHIAPALGGHHLSDLRKFQVLRWRNAQLDRGDHPRSVSHRMAVLRAALSWAVEMEMIATNPGLVSGPSVPQSDAKPLTVNEAKRFLAATLGDEWYAFYLLAFTLGVRQGEILGLRWRYVGDGKAEIANELTWLHGEPTIQPPKTPRSHRTLELPSRVQEALEARRTAQRLDRIANRDSWSPLFDDGYDFIFTNQRGYPIERTRITRAFQRHLREAGLPKVDFRSSRHTATDWLTELGLTMREVADVLGHSKPSMTADVYSWLGNAATEKAKRVMDEALG